jgi:hypothetical protein
MHKKGANHLAFSLQPSAFLYVGPENRQHGNKPDFTRVSLPFSAGNTAATAGNMLLVFTLHGLRTCIKIAI